MKRMALVLSAIAILNASPRSYGQDGVLRRWNRQFAARSLDSDTPAHGGGFYADQLIVCFEQPKAEDMQSGSAATSQQQRPLGRFALQQLVQLPPNRGRADRTVRQPATLRRLDREELRQPQNDWREEQADREASPDEAEDTSYFYDQQEQAAPDMPRPARIVSMSHPLERIPTRYVATGHTSYFASRSRPMMRVAPHCAPRRSGSIASFPVTGGVFLARQAGFR